MATQPASDTPSAPAGSEIPEVQKLGGQLISAVRHGQDLTPDAARASARAASTSLKDVPGVETLPDAETLTAYGFDLAAQFRCAQKEFTLQPASTRGSTKSS